MEYHTPQNQPFTVIPESELKPIGLDKGYAVPYIVVSTLKFFSGRVYFGDYYRG